MTGNFDATRRRGCESTPVRMGAIWARYGFLPSGRFRSRAAPHQFGRRPRGALSDRRFAPCRIGRLAAEPSLEQEEPFLERFVTDYREEDGKSDAQDRLQQDRG